MEFVPAATLWVLATILAAIACTLYIPAVYYDVDPMLGGHTRVGLATLLSLLLRFWQFRTAILLAAVADVDVRRRHLSFGRWAAGFACTAVTAGFLTSRVGVTDPNLPLTYGDQPGMAVFLWTGSAFIMWIFLDIARVCRNNVPHVRAPALRSAFVLIAIGCILFAVVLLDRLLYGAVIRAEGTGSPTAMALTVPSSPGWASRSRSSWSAWGSFSPGWPPNSATESLESGRGCCSWTSDQSGTA